MKKILSIFLISALLICNVCFVYAETDYEKSYAKEDIEYLMSLGAINNSENVYPERNITRAEFVKIINKAFSFDEKAEENFPDIQADKWYYNDFLTAKKQGYITGDALGYATPEKNLTRAEAAVILSRITEVKNAEIKSDFSDWNIIPEWASKNISNLVSAGIISGYPDRSFKPYNYLTRAEAFTLTVRSINYYKESHKNEEEKNNSSLTPPVPVVNEGSSAARPSYSGGGGSGGGGSSVPVNVNVTLPIINQLNEADSELTFITVANALSYTITASYESYSESKEVYESVKDKPVTVDLSDIISAITNQVKLPEIPISISVRTNATYGYISSPTVEIGTITKTFTFLDSPEVKVAVESLPDAEHLVISWNEIENADDYNISLTVDSEDITSSVLINKQSRVAVIKDITLVNTASEIKFEISALSDADDIVDSVPTVSIINYSAFGSTEGTGTEDDPYIIRNADDFELIRTNLDKHFLLASNITIDGNFEPFGSFSGSLKGYDIKNNTPKKRIISLIIDKPTTDKVGLFSELSGSATIDSIVIEGSITGNGKVGAIAGTAASGNMSVTNCVNKADITAGANEAGGILGSITVGGLVSHCSNLADIISSASNVGGIIGYPNISGASPCISNCSNYGQIIGIYNIGGIAGAAYGGITKSFNAGYVESLSGAAGGIAAVISSASDPITYCYNVGAVKARSVAGGIAYGPANASSSLLIKYCYYAGESLEGTTNNFPISTTNANSTLTNNLYVLENNTNLLDGTISVTSLELQDAENENTKILLTEDDEGNKFVMLDGFTYPQLPDNLYGEEYLNLPLSAPENADASANAVTWENYDERIVRYNVKIIDKNSYDIIANEEIASSETGSEQFTFAFENGILYEIIITGLSSDGSISDSTAFYKSF